MTPVHGTANKHNVGAVQARLIIEIGVLHSRIKTVALQTQLGGKSKCHHTPTLITVALQHNLIKHQASTAIPHPCQHTHSPRCAALLFVLPCAAKMEHKDQQWWPRLPARLEVANARVPCKQRKNVCSAGWVKNVTTHNPWKE